jgi:hypothetical protein
MRGRLVLLDDEDAGADASDRELLMALGAPVLDLDGLRSPAQGRLERRTRTAPSSSRRTQPPTPSSRARATTSSSTRSPPATTLIASRCAVTRRAYLRLCA